MPLPDPRFTRTGGQGPSAGTTEIALAQDDFHARLARIAERNGQTVEFAPPPPPPPRPRGGAASGGGSRAARLLGPVLGLAILAPAAAFALHVAMQTTDTGRGVADGRGLFDRVAPREIRADELLPAPAQGWVRVTEADARPDVQQAISDLAARYPGGEAALRRHPAFQAVGRFLDEAAKPASMMNRKSPRTRGLALYVATGGELFSAELELLAPDKALGPEGDPAAWAERVAHVADLYSGPGGGVAQHRIGPFRAVETHGRAGPRLQPGSRSPAQFVVTVPLDARAKVTLRAMAAPASVDRFLRTLNLPAIAARTQQTFGS